MYWKREQLNFINTCITHDLYKIKIDLSPFTNLAIKYLFASLYSFFLAREAKNQIFFALKRKKNNCIKVP